MNKVYTVYQTTCLVNGKTYIGCHKTSNPDDSYLGSGVAFSHAVKKYGKENFKKEVLFIFDNPEEMLAKERELVVVDQEKTYNLDRGGWPGFGSRSPEELLRAVQKGNAVVNEKYPGFQQRNAQKGRAVFEEKLRVDESFKENFLTSLRDNLVLACNAALSDQSRLKRKETFKRNNHSQGKKNSQFGTCWVKKDGVSLKISLSCLEQYLSEGYIRGRILTSRP